MFPINPIRLRIIRCVLLIPALGALGWGLTHRESISAVAPPASTPTAAEGPLAVFFSRPQDFDGEYAGGPDETLARAVDQAGTSIDIAVYDFDLLSVARALARAHRRGVTVRIVVDSDHWHTEAVDFLRAEGIPIVGDGREALMHDKFVVIDNGEIWAGSMNLTVNDAYRNDNNLLRIRSGTLARIFSAEFEEMFAARRFGPASPYRKPAAVSEAGIGTVEALFAPEDRIADRLIGLILEARRSIRFLAFSFTSGEIAGAMRMRMAAGVSLSGVFESTQVRSNSGAQHEFLYQEGAAVLLDTNPRNMHHKVILIDGEIVITGSYNFTLSAESRNDEDLLILWNPELAEAFEKEFRRIYDMAAVGAVESPAAGILRGFEAIGTAFLFSPPVSREI